MKKAKRAGEGSGRVIPPHKLHPNPDSICQDGGKSVKGSPKEWSDLMVRTMMLSTEEVEMELDIKRFAIKLSHRDERETVKLILRSPEDVQVFVDGSLQDSLPRSEILAKIAGKLEDIDVGESGDIEDSLEGMNFFLNLTTLTTMVKLALLLKRDLEEKAVDEKAREIAGRKGTLSNLNEPNN